MMISIDDAKLRELLQEAMTKTSMRMSPLGSAAHEAAKDVGLEFKAIASRELLAIFADDGFVAQLRTRMRDAVLEAAAEKVTAAVKRMPQREIIALVNRVSEGEQLDILGGSND